MLTGREWAYRKGQNGAASGGTGQNDIRASRRLFKKRTESGPVQMPLNPSALSRYNEARSSFVPSCILQGLDRLPSPEAPRRDRTDI